jgi:hypothetical protein
MLEALLAREIHLALIKGPEQRKDLHIVEQQASDVFARLERENYLKELTRETFSDSPIIPESSTQPTSLGTAIVGRCDSLRRAWQKLQGMTSKGREF